MRSSSEPWPGPTPDGDVALPPVRARTATDREADYGGSVISKATDMRRVFPVVLAAALLGPIATARAEVLIEASTPDALLSLLETREEAALRERQVRPSLRLLMLQPALRVVTRQAHGHRS